MKSVPDSSRRDMSGFEQSPRRLFDYNPDRRQKRIPIEWGTAIRREAALSVSTGDAYPRPGLPHHRRNAEERDRPRCPVPLTRRRTRNKKRLGIAHLSSLTLRVATTMVTRTR